MTMASDLRRMLATVYNATLTRLPADRAAAIDYLRPALRHSWGSALNGQRHRQDIVRELVWRIPFDVVVETGTFRGSSCEFLAQVTGKPVHTVEAEPRFHGFARRRLMGYPDVEVSLGDSRAFLARLAADSSTTDATGLFYLEAHWHEDLPLVEELEIISAAWQRAVIMIDDFEVPGDPGYGFDDYGPGKSLTASTLPEAALAGWGRYYPSLPASAETGARRGCIVLASPAVNGLLADAVSIRQHVERVDLPSSGADIIA